MTRDAIVIAAWWPKWERWVVALAYEPAVAELIYRAFRDEFGGAYWCEYRTGRVFTMREPDLGNRAEDVPLANLRRIDACHRAALAVGDLGEAERFASEHMRARSVGAGAALGSEAA